MVVGAGAAGTAAAIEAARAGVRVTLVDENPIGVSMMGLDVPQFIGRRVKDPLPARDVMLERVVAANSSLAEAEEAGVEVQLGTCVWGAFRNSDTSRVLDGPQLGLADDERSWMVKYDRLIVAAGARDLAMSFPGSGLAGVMGANGAHALMSRYQALASRRMVVLGAGNLGLTTAQMALDRGVEVAAVVDVSSSARGDEALLSRLRGAGVELYTSHTVKEAVGGAGEIESVVLVEIDDDCDPVAGTEKVVAADTVCLAIGLVPNVELLALLGCDLAFASERGGWAPVHDDRMRTSVDSVFVAGDVAGFHDGMVLDAEIARNQGRLAGIAAAESLGAIDEDEALARIDDLKPTAVDAATPDAHSGWQRWHRSLVNAGGLEVLACQCEEVTRAEIIGLQPPRYLGRGSEQASRRNLRTQAGANPVNADQVKRLTRAGMGHCQGRLCREQVALLLAEESGADIADIPVMSYRPPVRPLPLRVMWPHDEPEQVRCEWPKWFSPTHRVLG
ncbi:MAG: NAD(P)/FAD-dependent oxidoreductase [Chloroflexota bacterium]|nr:NAD(P)/FAD-dependent oxidoreductase [Chloroflexota bacterium]